MENNKSLELIKAEIERRKIICEGIFERDSDTYYQGKAVAYGELLPFIDSLPECEETAKIPTEKYEEELNEEIQGFIDEYGYERGEDKILIAIVARHFAEWQKEQMMKDAVEGYVAQRVHGELYAKAKVPESMNLKFGDKVKIIIVKQ